MKQIFSFLLLFSFFTSSAQDRSKWFEFYLPWDDSTKTITDMSGYLDAPAGKYGFLKTTPDGHFRFENSNENIRFVGVVNVSLGNFPTREEAKIIAARMAKFGINMVRIHMVDIPDEQGLFTNASQNTLDISPEKLDKLDYFISCLKGHGIYFNFCIHTARIFTQADGIDAPIQFFGSHQVTLFNRKLIELQKDFANETLGHINPYTGLTYAKDPAMSTLELTNENSLLDGWLSYGSDILFPENPKGIGIFYATELDTRFNAWLASKYGDDQKLKQSWSGINGDTSPELIKNGSFEQNFTDWSSSVNTPNVQGTITIDATAAKNGSKSAKIVVTQTGEQDWYLQLKPNIFPVEEGASYKLSFYAKSNVVKELSMDIMETDTWKWIAGPAFTTTADWKLYEIHFTAPFTSAKAIAQFNFGKQLGTFWLDSLSLTYDPGIGLSTGESLALKNIKRTRWSDLPNYTAQRTGDNAEFYADLEEKYRKEMSDYAKNDLGVKCPVNYTNNYLGLASVYSMSKADYTDAHYYWGYHLNADAASDLDMYYPNKSVLLEPENSPINLIPLCKVKNKPLVISEYNHEYPYIFQSEAPSLLYAYGSFIGLDGIYWHAYYDMMNRYSQRWQDMLYDIAEHPVMMTQMMLALPYRMNNIKQAQTYAEGNYKLQDVFNNSKTYQENRVLNLKHNEIGTSFLQHGFQHADFNADSSYLSGAIPDPGKIITSETNELKWDANQGIFTVNSPYWQGTTGFLGGKNIELNNITISGVTTTDGLNFAAIHLIALDSLPIHQSKKMLLLTSARMENEGFLWNSTQTQMVSVGGTRALCEPVKATIKFKWADSDSLMVFSLNEKGQRAQSLAIEQIAESADFALDKNTLWYEISNQKISRVSLAGIKPSIEDDNNFLKIHPNPAKDQATLEYSFTGQKNGRFLLFNSMGQCLQNELIQFSQNIKNEKQLNTVNLQNGLYFCGFHFENGKSVLEKLIVNH